MTGQYLIPFEVFDDERQQLAKKKRGGHGGSQVGGKKRHLPPWYVRKMMEQEELTWAAMEERRQRALQAQRELQRKTVLVREMEERFQREKLEQAMYAALLSEV